MGRPLLEPWHACEGLRIDAQTHEFTDEGLDCKTGEGFEEQQCGCGRTCSGALTTTESV